MQEKPSAPNTLGLEYCGDTIKLVALSRNSKGSKLDFLDEVAIEKSDSEDSTIHVKPLYTKNQQKQVTTFVNSNLVVTAVPTNQTLVRPLSTKLKKNSDIDSTLSFQAEPLLPYSVENAVVDRIILDKNKDSTNLTIVATRKDYLSSHILFWNALKVEPEVISCVPQALAAFVGELEQTCLAIHITHNETTCALIKKGALVAAKSFSKGTDELFSAYIKDVPGGNKHTFKELDHSLIDSQQYPSLSETLHQLNLEITRLVFSHAKVLKGIEVNNILITGEAATIQNLDLSVGKYLGKELIDPEERPQFSIPIRKQKQYALPIGMALTGLNNGTDQINFRQGEHAYPDPWKRIKKPVTMYIGLCFLLTLAFYIFSTVYIEYKQDSLKEEYAALLGYMNKPHAQFENEFNSKQKRDIDIEEVGIVSLVNLSKQELEERLSFLQKEIREAPDTFPLLPNIPRVSDVLAWLSTHDVILGKEKESDEINPRIQLEKFSYKMLKRPEKNKKNNKYQVKVDFEFTSTSPRAAREFHDALLEPNPIVDLNNEVKWSATRGKYKTSFFLKDRTIYHRTK